MPAHRGLGATHAHTLCDSPRSLRLTFSQEHTDVLAETNEFVLTGRYPDTTFSAPSLDDAEAHQRKAQEVFQWLIQQL